MAFSDIIGQSQAKKQLADMVKQNRLSHALLMLGPEGSGSLSLALAFTQYLVCEKLNRQPAGKAGSLFGEDPEAQPAINDPYIPEDACGVCPACIKSKQFIHPDIHFSYPVVPRKSGDKPVSTDYISEWRAFIQKNPYGNAYDWLQFINAENRQGNITALECNEIIHKLSLKSFESGYKILLMWMPEYLGNEGNKLLKLIEEPPPDTLFLLVAENESLILPTILSRTQLFKIPALENEEVAGALEQRAKMAPELAKQVAAVVDGNYREALQVMHHADEDWNGLLRDWLNAILKNGPIAQVKWVEEISKSGRERQKQFLRYFNHLLEQAIRLRVLNISIPEKEKDFASRLNKIADIDQQQAIIEEIDKAAYYIERNAHGKMLFHALTIKLYHILAHKTVASVN